MASVEPFLRWAGGKKWLIKHLPQITGNMNFNHYHELFLGGGAIYFTLNHNKQSYLSDTNTELITTYIAVRDNPNEIIEILKHYQNTEDDYYQIRSSVPKSSVELAARFIYLNQTSFNGLYRVNRKGEYNVPYGFRSNYTFNFEQIQNASLKLRNTSISHGDFDVKKNHITSNDLVFLDPPYTVSHNNNGFIEYNRKLFSIEDQYRLCQLLTYIKSNGAYYILTNAAHSTIREIFDIGDRMITLERKSLIGGKNSNRGSVSEYIFTNIPEVAIT